jgi:hypothetical protein
MKTIHLKENSPPLRQLLTLAEEESVLLIAGDGKTFILEEADQFEREVKKLGESERFMSFLKDRASVRGTIPIEQVARELGGGGS